MGATAAHRPAVLDYEGRDSLEERWLHRWLRTVVGAGRLASGETAVVPFSRWFALFRACPVWVHFHARLVFRVTDRIVLLRVRPTASSRRPFDPPSPGYFLLSGIRISFSSLPSLVFSSRARRSARFGQRPELRLGSWPPRNHPEIVRQQGPHHLALLVRMPLAQ